VRAEARKKGDTVHFGRIVELCMEKGSELPEGDPQREFKGRSVFLGDNVKDEYFNWAEFADLGSSPPSMEAAKALDALGSLPGYVVKTGDARGAYTQSYLEGSTTWVALPENRRPKAWLTKYTNPIVPLILSLYGHPDAGGYWEKHCEKQIAVLGFQKVGEEWNSVYWHPSKKAMLIVYVDDFKLAARKEDHDGLWKNLRKFIDMDAEAIDGRFLGCLHESFNGTAGDVIELLKSQPQYHPRPNMTQKASQERDSCARGLYRSEAKDRRRIVQHARLRGRMRDSVSQFVWLR
jgi:hypothetical protein